MVDKKYIVQIVSCFLLVIVVSVLISLIGELVSAIEEQRAASKVSPNKYYVICYSGDRLIYEGETYKLTIGSNLIMLESTDNEKVKITGSSCVVKTGVN